MKEHRRCSIIKNLCAFSVVLCVIYIYISNEKIAKASQRTQRLSLNLYEVFYWGYYHFSTIVKPLRGFVICHYLIYEIKKEHRRCSMTINLCVNLCVLSVFAFI